ncbi:MAG: response regulator [Desulfobacterales bacterium]|jgi:CheY-like chemotaxis protein|nr:MAG: response regulator [Desulfobacterales bacterium]
MQRVLVIDDEPQIRSLLRLILEREGFEVEEATDGIAGIKIYRQNPVDLIISDLIMPNKDGIGMIIELKKEFPDVKIIAMSGGGLNKPEGYLEGAKKLGAQRTLTKPIDRDKLLRAIKDILKANQSQTGHPKTNKIL